MSGIHIIDYEHGIESLRTFNVDTSNRDKIKMALNRYLDLEGTDAAIDKIAVYGTPLEDNVMVQLINIMKRFYHAYIYLQIGDRHISFDKHSDGLTIQVSKERYHVLFMLGGNTRNGRPEEIVADNSHTTVRELVDFFVQRDFINEGYSVWYGKHSMRFAKDIFDKIAAVKSYDW